MPDWSLLNWLDAGTAPLLVLVFLLQWRIDRRLLKVETELELDRGRGVKHAK